MSSSVTNFPDIPKPFLKLFPESLNKVQQQSYHDIWNTDNNIIVQAPTGSGKTVIAQLAILKALLKPGKALYLGPLRALNHEKFAELRKFDSLNWKTRLVLGGSSPSDLSDYDILLSTPEKFLSLLHSLNFSSFPLSVIVIDEIHLLAEGKRGAYLEYLLMFLRTHYPSIRLIGLSATIPNTFQLAEWLQATPLIYDNSYRSTQLQTKLIDLPESMQEKFGRMVKAYQISKKFLPNQSLIFTTSRANVHFYAKMFTSWAQRDELPFHSKVNFQNQKLSELSYYGIAFYHAGLSESDKKKIIKEFLNNNIKILISTSSLAWGVNLPAKAVIIADLDYNNPLTGKETMSSSDILQMLGRAGRPQHHDKGYGYVVVSKDQKEKIEGFIEGSAPVRSSLRDYFPELLLLYLSHIPQETILFDDLAEFFEQSFLVSSKYTTLTDINDSLEEAIRILFLAKLIIYENFKINITSLGLATSKFFIHPDTASNLISHQPDITNLMNFLPFISEFNNIVVRNSEKKFLRQLGASTKTYQVYKLQYIISTAEKGNKLNQEFIGDGKVIYQEYKRIKSYYEYISNIFIDNYPNNN